MLLETKTIRTEVNGILQLATPLLRQKDMPQLHAPKESVMPNLRSVEECLLKDPVKAETYRAECQSSVVCHVFPPLVSIFGLFTVLVSCYYELSMFQLCLSHCVLIIPCILVLSFEFDFVWSTCVSPVYLVCQPCLVLPCQH